MESNQIVGYHAGVRKTFYDSMVFHHENRLTKCFQMFMKSPRSKRMCNKTEEDIEKTKKYVEENEIYLIAHSGYLFNIATQAEEDSFTVKTAVDDINTVVKLGGVGAVFHVGKHLKRDCEECLDNMENLIRTVISKTTGKFILETAAGQGTELLTKMEELGQFYSRFTKEEKERVKICIDTCHVFAAGYDLKTPEKVIQFCELIEACIGWKNVEVIHLNDSKGDTGCCKDRHENIGLGEIGDEGLMCFVQFCYSKGIPMILETPMNMDRMEELAKVRSWVTK